MDTQPVNSSAPSRYIYGTTRLGDGKIAFDDRVAMARSAIEAGLWLHTSDQYGDALSVLKTAIGLSQSPVRGTLFKIGWDSVLQIREQIERQLEATGLTRMTVGQLCLGGTLAEDFKSHGREIDALLALQSEGLVDGYVLELWPWNSEVALAGLRNGNAGRLLKGLIFYLNPLQRFVTNELWDTMQTQGQAFIAMRTVGGGSVYRIRDVEGAAPDYLRSRAAEVAPVYERSGCATWTEFCVRYALGFRNCLATVGATSKPESLSLFIDAATQVEPLAEEIQQELLTLQRRWSDDHDRHAKPWSM